MSRRWCAGVEYLGTAYGGWQAQGHVDSVQARVEAALSAIADAPLRVHCAGRTDAGVHALQQVVHFDSAAARDAYAWLVGGNSRLPADISLRWVQPAADDFHARHSANRRHYRYVIHNSRARSAQAGGRATWWTWPLDAERMHQAAQALIGEHDFSAFRAAECQSSTPMRRLDAISVTRHGDYVLIDVCANAFLHHMVRNISGTLLYIGQGRAAPDWAGELLAGRDRSLAGPTAPPQGLYFVGPEYPPRFAVPAPPRPPGAWPFPEAS